jgi:hypothetical protein
MCRHNKTYHLAIINLAITTTIHSALAPFSPNRHSTITTIFVFGILTRRNQYQPYNLI